MYSTQYRLTGWLKVLRSTPRKNRSLHPSQSLRPDYFLTLALYKLCTYLLSMVLKKLNLTHQSTHLQPFLTAWSLHEAMKWSTNILLTKSDAQEQASYEVVGTKRPWNNKEWCQIGRYSVCSLYCSRISYCREAAGSTSDLPACQEWQTDPTHARKHSNYMQQWLINRPHKLRTATCSFY